MRSRTGSRPALAAILLTLAPVLSGCTGDDGPQPDDAAADLAAAMTAGRLGGVAAGPDTPRPQELWTRLTDGMGEATAEVEVADVVRPEDAENSADVALRLTWTLPETEETWSHEGAVRLTRAEDGPWQAELDERMLGLEPGEVLDLSPLAAKRARITGAGGAVIVRERPVLRFGIDKTRVEPGQQAAAARALARVLDLDPAGLVQRVRAAGERAFVEALVLREAEATGPLLAVEGIEGVGVVADTLPLAPTRDFARPILGSVGAVTAEMVEQSEGRLGPGDEAGLSGLQQRYDEQLRGAPGWVVEAVDEEDRRRLFRVAPTPGEPVRTTLDVDLQTSAERILADVGPASALVAVRPSTGDVLAAASGPGGGGLSTATVGQYAPGSTFKVVTSLALLRGGLTAQSKVSCPARTVVDGKTFENYDDYPSSALGSISLRQAVANSCNTAFITARDRAEDLAGAAAALGLGTDYDVGFPAYFGQVPAPGSETSAAAAAIGQGQVLASPLAMAAVAASVADGRTVVPHLVDGFEPEQAVDDPLTGREAGVLRGLMRAVVTEGSGAGLADVPGKPVLAKTGTAEFGEDRPPATHAWMVGVQGDLAVAGFVEVGESGSRTAGPLVEELLRGAG